MKVNKGSLLKSVLVCVVAMALLLLLFHLFPSGGHPPLSWNEILNMWHIWIVILIVFIVATYFETEDDRKRKNSDKEEQM